MPLTTLGTRSLFYFEHGAAVGGAPLALIHGAGGTDAQRRARLRQEVAGHPEPRPARFFCALAVALPDGTARVFEGACYGQILLEERGSHGFGYDPLFFVPEYGCSMAELPPEVKNQISHRAHAVQAALDYLKSVLGASRSPAP